MTSRPTRGVICLVLCASGLGSVPVRAALPATTLAASVPADARLFLEVRGLDAIAKMSASTGIAEMLSTFADGEESAAQSRPAADWPLRRMLATAVGLGDDRAAELLFGGRLGLAADGWSGLGDAVLLARPIDPAALEGELAPLRDEDTADLKVRRYRLRRNHELACDGATVVVGRPGARSGLFARTTVLLGSEERVALSDLAEFQKRTSLLPDDAQVVAYVGTSSTDSGSHDLVTAWWPASWPRLRSLAMGLVLTPQGMTVELNGRIDPDGPTLARHDPPTEAMYRLPDTLVAAWSQSIDYVGEFRQVRNTYPHADDHVRFDLLESGLEPGSLERHLLSHLVGDTILVVDQVEVRAEKARDENDTVLMPAFGLLVETDDPDAVAGMLVHLAGNLLRLLKVQAETDEPVPLQEEALGSGGPVMFSVPLGEYLADRTQCEFFRSLKISGTVADRWVVLATHAETVRRIVQARRGQAPALPSDRLRTLVAGMRESGGQPRTVLLARPQAASAMVDSWLDNISRHHPQMRSDQWWEKLRRRHQASGRQLGIYGRASGGAVEVVEPIPNSPADGRLQPGDRILAADGIKLDSAEPLKSLRDAIALRPRPDRIDLLVERAGRQQSVEIVLARELEEAAGMHPLELLKRAANVCRPFASATHVVWQRAPDGVDVRLELSLEAGN